MSFTYSFEDGFFVEWANRAEVEHFSVDIMFSGEEFSCFEGGQSGASMGDEGDVSAFAFEVGDTEWNNVFFFGNFPFFSVKKGIFHEHDRIVVTDGCFEEPFSVVSRCRANDFEARNVSDPVFWGVRMSCADVCTAVSWAADNDRAIDKAAAHVANHTGIVDDLIPSDGGEAPEHQFHNWANP